MILTNKKVVQKKKVVISFTCPYENNKFLVLPRSYENWLIVFPPSPCIPTHQLKNYEKRIKSNQEHSIQFSLRQLSSNFSSRYSFSLSENCFFVMSFSKVKSYFSLSLSWSIF